MNIPDVVSGRAKWKGIHFSLFSAKAREFLAGQLRAVLPAGTSLGPFHPREVLFKPGRKLTPYYDASVYSESRDRCCVRPIEVTSGPDTGRDSGEDLGKAAAEAERRSVAAPFVQLMADLPDWNTTLSIPVQEASERGVSVSRSNTR